ncbi:MAG TPA: transposase family protein [Anaerolineales bacterium]
MITYERLLKKPQVAKSLIGMALVEFDQFYAEFEMAHTEQLQSSVNTRGKKKRQRAAGAGRKHKYALRDRLLMTMFWLKAYTTYELLGFFYDLNKTNIEDNLNLILETLVSMSSFNFERPKAERKKLHSVAEVMDAFPEVRLIIDAKEQRVERPKNKKDKDGNTQDRQKPYYSGKKKTHTIKNQAAVSPTGLSEHASESVPGGSTHDVNLLRQTNLLSELDDDEAAMMDKGYDGIATDYPDKKLYLPFKARRNHPLTEEQKAYNRFLAKYRIVVEHTMAQLNKFQILAQRFRHQLTRHSVIFRIVCGLVNRRIQLRPLKRYNPA